MASNSFGTIFKITTWGESHGKAIGVVIDGCPAGIELSLEEIDAELSLRAPGKNAYMTPRKEADRAEVLSGIFEGKTTGTPISILIWNSDADSTKYEPIKHLLRPGHANFTYLNKYGLFDYRGGGRASARETACRVAAGAVAKKFLKHHHISVIAYIKQIGDIRSEISDRSFEEVQLDTYQSPVFCPDKNASEQMMTLIEQVKNEDDSLGAMIEFITQGVPCGLGDPIYHKLEANLAYALMSLPATKGFEIGSGFESISLRGSTNNDIFSQEGEIIQTDTNHAGGTLAGISTGMPLIGRVAFKPTSSIMRPQETLTTEGKKAVFEMPQGSRHDPCVAIRAVPIVEAMVALVLADSLLLNRCAQL